MCHVPPERSPGGCLRPCQEGVCLAGHHGRGVVTLTLSLQERGCCLCSRRLAFTAAGSRVGLVESARGARGRAVGAKPWHALRLTPGCLRSPEGPKEAGGVQGPRGKIGALEDSHRDEERPRDSKTQSYVGAGREAPGARLSRKGWPAHPALLSPPLHAGGQASSSSSLNEEKASPSGVL